MSSLSLYSLKWNQTTRTHETIDPIEHPHIDELSTDSELDIMEIIHGGIRKNISI